MGLDAYVPCSCITRGLAKPCPLPIVSEDNGQWAAERREDDRAFYDWRQTACVHPRMEAVTERVANWAGVRTLQDALHEVGEPVAVLLATLPDSNGGSVDAATSKVCLEQIETFRRLFRRMTCELVNAHTGKVVYDYVSAYEGQFVWSQNGNVGFDDAGVFVTDTQGQVVFRARRVMATPLEKGCILRDLDSAATVECGWSQEAPTPYEVIDHVETGTDHEAKLVTLEKLFRGAVEHDTCVVWC